MKYIVYKTTNKLNGKVYVGVHRTNPDIFDGYLGCGAVMSKSNTIKSKGRPDKGIGAAIKKYGPENFIRETLFEYPDTEEGCAQAYAKEAEIVNIE